MDRCRSRSRRGPWPGCRAATPRPAGSPPRAAARPPSSARPQASPSPSARTPASLIAPFMKSPVSSTMPKRPACSCVFDVLRGAALARDLDVVDRGGAVHREMADHAALHQLDQARRDADLDHVPAHIAITGRFARCAAATRAIASRSARAASWSGSERTSARAAAGSSVPANSSTRTRVGRSSTDPTLQLREIRLAVAAHPAPPSRRPAAPR